MKDINGKSYLIDLKSVQTLVNLFDLYVFVQYFVLLVMIFFPCFMLPKLIQGNLIDGQLIVPFISLGLFGSLIQYLHILAAKGIQNLSLMVLELWNNLEDT